MPNLTNDKIWPTSFTGDADASPRLYGVLGAVQDIIPVESVAKSSETIAPPAQSKGGVKTGKGGKDKDQYGRKFGKRAQGALVEFSREMWLQDAVGSLPGLLRQPAFRSAFETFLKKEYANTIVSQWCEVDALLTMEPGTPCPRAAAISRNSL